MSSVTSVDDHRQAFQSFGRDGLLFCHPCFYSTHTHSNSVTWRYQAWFRCMVIVFVFPQHGNCSRFCLRVVATFWTICTAYSSVCSHCHFQGSLHLWQYSPLFTVFFLLLGTVYEQRWRFIMDRVQRRDVIRPTPSPNLKSPLSFEHKYWVPVQIFPPLSGWRCPKRLSVDSG